MKRLQFLNVIASLVATLCFTAATPAFAGEPTLHDGDPAPKLAVGAWVQGEPVTAIEPGKAYLIDFWATWCPPCVASVPDLNEIHKKFKDQGLIVIGQAVSKMDKDKVKPFVTKMGDKMTYRVALDDFSKVERGAMATTWYDAAGQTGIPVIFLVGKDGKIAWIGHPIELTDVKISEVLSPTTK